VVLAGVERVDSLALELHVERLAPRPSALAVAVDRSAPASLAVPEHGILLVPIPPGGRGVRLDIAATEPGSVRLTRLALRPEGRPWTAVVLAVLLAVAAYAIAATLRHGAAAVPLGLWIAGLCGLWAAPVLVFWSLPSVSGFGALLPAVVLLLAAPLLAARRGARRTFWIGAALATSAVVGLAVRLYFLPSAGSWDVDYWKAYAERGSQAGVTRVYGDPLPDGAFWPQLEGRQPQWQAEALGRTFVIDQPPGIAAAWTASWWLTRHVMPDLTRDESLNGAAKLPGVLGDAAATLMLLAFFRSRPLRGATLAALYWALPISWLSSAVLGFFDGAYVPLAILAVWLAGRGKAEASGAAQALAGLVKATSLLVVPAVVVALRAARASLVRALLVGASVVAVAVVPFAADGTLGAMVVHVYRILFQERLSGGLANGWWLIGHALTLGVGGRTASDPVPFVHISALALPARTVGALLLLAVLIHVARLQRRHAGRLAAALAAATFVIAYGQLAIGVHENHTHAFVLAMLATGLFTRRLRVLATLLMTSYVLNMLCLSGLGRFYTLRYVEIEGLVSAVGQLRMWPGFDLTLLLAAINLGGFGLLLAHLEEELAELEIGQTAGV